MSHNHREVRRVTANSEPSASEWQLGPDPRGLLRARPTSQERHRSPRQWETWTYRGRAGCALSAHPGPTLAISCANPGAHTEILGQARERVQPQGMGRAQGQDGRLYRRTPVES